MLKVCPFEEIKISIEKFLESDGVKSNYENKMKSIDEIPSHHGREIGGTYFFCDSLNKNIPRKK